MWLVIIIAAIGIVVVIENLVYNRLWDRGVSADVSFSADRALEGDTIELIEVAEHKGRLPLPWLTLKFQMSRDITLPDSKNSSVTDNYNREDVFSIRRGERITRRLPAKCTKRGFHRVSSTDILSSDIFLSRKLVRNLKTNAHITVYPRMTDVPDIDSRVRSIMGDYVVKSALNQDPFFFKGVRDYMPGDQAKHVNWKATARTGELEVNEFDYTSSRYVSIWLDTENEYLWIDHELHEESIRIAASLIDGLIADGVPVGLRSNSADIVTGERIDIAPGNSPEHLDTCLTALARMKLEKNPPSIMRYVNEISGEGSSDELIVIIAAYHSDKLIEWLRELEQMPDRSVLFIRVAKTDDDRTFKKLSALDCVCVWRVDCD